MQGMLQVQQNMRGRRILVDSNVEEKTDKRRLNLSSWVF